MSLSPQLANYLEQPIMSATEESPAPSTWLIDQPAGQYVRQPQFTPSSHTNRQPGAVPSGYWQGRGTDVLEWLKKSVEMSKIPQAVPEEFVIEGKARAGASRCLARPRVDEKGLQTLVLRELERTFVFEGRIEVADFIRRNRISELLLEARSPLDAAFGETAVKRLTLVEDDEGSSELFCLVLVSGDMEMARRALESFDGQWWLARSGQASGKLNFDFELI